MKRITAFLILVAAFSAAFLLVLTIAGAGAVPAAESAVVDVQLLTNIRHDYAYVRTNPVTPNVPATITVYDSSGSMKASVSGMTNDMGNFGSWHASWQPDHPDIMPGDKVVGEVDGSTSTIDKVGSISGLVDFAGDKITGVVDASWFPTVKVKCVTWNDTTTGPEIELVGIAGDNGSFACDFGQIGWDVARGWDFEISYLEPDGDEIQSQPLVTWMRVNYGHEWVGGEYPAGHKIAVTLKDKDGLTKATAEVESMPNAGWDGDGFQTQYEDWTPRNVDIVPGDTVHFAADDGYTHEVRVGNVNGTIDYVNNKVTGTILVPWLSGELPVECHPWGAPGDWPGVQNSTAAADGSSSYECAWDTAIWTIQPGQDIGVMYREPDDDKVINPIQDPVPEMGIEKWVPGGTNEVDVNGPAVFQIWYRNHGQAQAATITISDTLPAGTTYIADSSGVAPTIGGGQLVWEMGPVAAGDEEQFFLVLGHTGSVNDTLTNEVEIYTANDWHDDNDHAAAEVHIGQGQPDLYVHKDGQSSNPVPGGTYLYRIDYGNNGPVPSGPVVFTDTLPANTEFVGYYSREGYDLWTGAVNNGQLILNSPSIPAQWGDSIMLRIRVKPEVAVDTELENKAEIWTSNDSDTGNNMSTHYTYVGEPYWDLRVFKDPRWGSLFPGGHVQYRLELNNEGNMPVMAKLVDTLPEGTYFIETYDYEDPTIQNGTLTWDIGEMLPGEQIDLHFRLGIKNSVTPETVLENCVEAVMVNHVDDDPGDNISCTADMVHESGPNVRVFKESWWQGENGESIEYSIWLGNTGTTNLKDVVVIDTYPEGTTFNGDWWSWWGDFPIAHDGAQREIKWTLPEMNAGEFLHIYFTVDLDGALVGEQGLSFLNRVEAPMTGDVYPADNVYEQWSYTGADLYIKKWTAAKDPSPGDTVFFTVEFGNANPSYWDTEDAVIEETIPAGLKFIRATDPWDPSQTWHPDRVSGDTFAWDVGHLWAGAKLQFEIEVEIEQTVKPGQTMTNMIEIFSSNPNETDPVPENNQDMADVALPKIYLPVMMGT
ncbi:MAG: hypothetical protein R3293_09890 [Candidatus Promineifilaceae bacterium]|nr:hypothetical protein [Candidatus Promineifilaceae bacterium]